MDMAMLGALGRKVIPLHTDEKLVRRVQQGDQRAFDDIVARYKTPLFRYLCRLTRNTQEAEDLTQETFLRAWRGLAHLGREDRLKPWLYAIATNTARTHFGKVRRLPQREMAVGPDAGGEDWVDRLEDTGASVESLLDRDRLKEVLKEAVGALPSPYKEVVVMRDMEEMNYEDIAVALGLNLGTVKSRIARGRVLLQDKLVEAGL